MSPARSRLVFFCLFFLLVQRCRHTAAASAPSPIVVAVASPKQRIDGFGTSLCWWANAVGAWHNETLFDEVMDLFFSSETGLGLRQVRYNIGGTTATSFQCS